MRVGLRCDASPRGGVGHLMRCVALAEALLADGAEVVLLGAVDGVDWLRDQLPVAVVPGGSSPGDLVDQAQALALDAVVLDSYDLDPRCAGALRAAGVATLAVVDGDARGQVADLYLDQNLDAEVAGAALTEATFAAGAAPAGSARLAGLRYALIRRAVVRRRPTTARTFRTGSTPHVLCFFGGTDAFGAAPTLTSLLIETAVPMVATVIVPDAAAAGPVRRAAAGQSITLVPPVADLPQLIDQADLVVTAAGTSTWDLLCLGVPPALLWVVDNQELGYCRTVGRGLAVGLGHLDDLRRSPAESVGRLRHVLTEPAVRADLAARGWAAVDGLGARRVARALAALVDDRRPVPVRDLAAGR